MLFNPENDIRKYTKTFWYLQLQNSRHSRYLEAAAKTVLDWFRQIWLTAAVNLAKIPSGEPCDEIFFYLSALIVWTNSCTHTVISIHKLGNQVPREFQEHNIVDQQINPVTKEFPPPPFRLAVYKPFGLGNWYMPHQPLVMWKLGQNSLLLWIFFCPGNEANNNRLTWVQEFMQLSRKQTPSGMEKLSVIGTVGLWELFP